MVAKADRGKTSVIMYTDEYNKNAHNLLNENNFQKLQKIPRTNTKNLSPRSCDIATLSSVRNKRSTSPRTNPKPPT